MNKIAACLAGFALFFALAHASYAAKVLTGDEIRALITNKTVMVTANGNQWRQYFAADGNSARDNGQISAWSIEGDKHCNTAAANFPCAPVRDNGDGTYARIKDNGDAVVTWSRIVDGKDF